MAAPSPIIGQVLGHYRIIEQVGAGGMGVVYRAHDEQLDRDVALKTLPQLGLLSEVARRQFKREALNLARITDPHVAMAFDFGHDNGIDYLVTEFVPGVTLDLRIAGRALPESEVLNFGRQMAAGLEAAHKEGVIHRDLKPSNLRITPDGRLKILDFGLAYLLKVEKAETAETASMTSTYSDAGTVPYMAPEQLKGLKPDVRSDLWSAGAVLYEMGTGKKPFGELSGGQLIAAILEQAPISPRQSNPKISEGLERVVLRALQKKPEQRYQSAGDLRIDLTNLATGTAPVHAVRETRRINRWIVVAFLALLLLAAGMWWRRSQGGQGGSAGHVMAVLPFESVTNDSAINALGLGLTQTITAKLVQATDGGRLQLVSTRDLVEHGIKSADQARREFGTDLVLEGSLQQSGEQVRITCSLVDARTHVQLAAKEVTGNANDMFELQDRLFDRVLEMLPLAGEPSARRELMRLNTKPAAYDFYLRGRGYLEEYQDLENLQNAIAQFENAIGVDKNYAPAYAAMGMAYSIGFQQKNQGRDWLENARTNCERALAITPQLAEGHTCLGQVYVLTGQYDDAVQQFEKSLDLDHTNDETLRALAAAYVKTGNVAAAEDAYRRAISVRPNYWSVYSAFGAFYFNQARYANAAEMFRKSIELAPLNYAGYSNLGATYLYQANYAGAVEESKHSINLRPTAEAYGNLGTAYFYLHRYEDAAQSFQHALKIDDKDWLNWGNLGDTLYQIPERRAEAVVAYSRAVDLAKARLEVNPKDANTLAYSADYLAMLGQEENARREMEQALAISSSDGDVLFRAAILYNHYGDIAQTLDYLSKAVKAGYSKTVIRDMPDFEHLKGESRFRSLLE